MIRLQTKPKSWSSKKRQLKAQAPREKRVYGDSLTVSYPDGSYRVIRPSDAFKKIATGKDWAKLALSVCENKRISWTINK